MESSQAVMAGDGSARTPPASEYKVFGAGDEARSEYFRLLDLPPEMVQHIFSMLIPLDLLPLRLVSKHAEALVFDVVADTYIRDLACYFMDPTRLDRLHEVLSAPRLRERVRTVTLTMDPFEDFDGEQVSVAPMQHEDLGSAQIESWWNFLEQQHRRYHTHPPDFTLLNMVLRKIAELNAELTLDFQVCGFFCLDQSYTAEVRKRAIKLGCRISELKITDETDPNVERLLNSNEYVLCKTLRSLRLNAYFNNTSKFNTRGTLLSTADFISSSEKLEELAVSFRPNALSRSGIDLGEVPNRLLDASRFTTLHTLRLSGIPVAPASLLQALQRCRERLEVLYLVNVHLLAPGREWTDTLSVAQCAPRLRELNLEALMRRANGLDEIVRFANPKNLGGAAVSAWESMSRTEICAGLDVILREGLRY